MINKTIPIIKNAISIFGSKNGKSQKYRNAITLNIITILDRFDFDLDNKLIINNEPMIATTNVIIKFIIIFKSLH